MKKKKKAKVKEAEEKLDPEINTKVFYVPKPQQERICVKIRGLTPLLMNPRTPSIIEEIERPQQEKQADPKAQRKPRNPQREFEEKLSVRSLNGSKGPWWFPAIGLKKAMCIAGYRFIQKVPQKVLRGVFFIHPDQIRIVTNVKPNMRTDSGFPQGPQKGLFVFYRPEFWPWSMEFLIDYAANQIDMDSILHLLILAGQSVGIGPWRIENSGNHGTYELEGIQQIVEKVEKG